MPEIWTVGYGGLGPEVLMGSLKRAGIEALVDVRSVPFSRHARWACREELKRWLKGEGVSYLWIKELGGRIEESSYEEVYGKEAFLGAVARLERGCEKMRVALFCSEMDPMECHRGLMIGEFLFGSGWRVVHLWPDWEEEHHEASLRLAKKLGMEEGLFWPGPLLGRAAVLEMGKKVLERSRL